MKELPSIKELRERFSYNPETGEIRYREATNRTRVGSVAGSLSERGYRYIQFKGRKYMAHHIAWAMHYGEWPPERVEIDHENRDASDNRIDNLRLASRSQNNLNRGRLRNNRAGLKGVTFHKSMGRWRATISVDGRHKHIGYYPTPEEAHAAYVKAAYDFHGEFANAG